VRSGHRSRPRHRSAFATLGPGREPFRGCRIRSRQAATPDPESFSGAGAESSGIRSFRRRIVHPVPPEFLIRTEDTVAMGSL